MADGGDAAEHVVRDDATAGVEGDADVVETGQRLGLVADGAESNVSREGCGLVGAGGLDPRGAVEGVAVGDEGGVLEGGAGDAGGAGGGGGGGAGVEGGGREEEVERPLLAAAGEVGGRTAVGGAFLEDLGETLHLPVELVVWSREQGGGNGLEENVGEVEELPDFFDSEGGLAGISVMGRQ